MLGELINGVKMTFLGVRYPQLIDLVENLTAFGFWLQENFGDEIKVEEFKEVWNEVKAKLDELEKKEDELSDEEIQTVLQDAVLKFSKVIGKYVKASKYDEEKNVLKLVLGKKKKLVLVITAKVR